MSLVERKQYAPIVPKGWRSIHRDQHMMIVIFVLVGQIFHDDPKYLQVIPV